MSDTVGCIQEAGDDQLVVQVIYTGSSVRSAALCGRVDAGRLIKCGARLAVGRFEVAAIERYQSHCGKGQLQRDPPEINVALRTELDRARGG